jgi:hypothetical protein
MSLEEDMKAMWQEIHARDDKDFQEKMDKALEKYKDVNVDAAVKEIQDELDKEFVMEMTQKLGMYLAPIPKMEKVSQRVYPPKRKLTSVIVEHAFNQVYSTAD